MSLLQSAQAHHSQRVGEYTKQKLTTELYTLQAKVGDEILIRIFKKEALLELWVRSSGSFRFQLFKTYPICNYSGHLGPKLRVNDKQTPEGIYTITNRRLNPRSQFYLSMNIGYPNRLDRSLGRTGSLIMIHGGCESKGCFAMSDSQIEEIFYLSQQALQNSQSKIEVHSFPFRLSSDQLSSYHKHPSFTFWQQLKVIHDFFNRHKRSPIIKIKNGQYKVETN